MLRHHTNQVVIQISSFNHHFCFYLSRYFPLALYMSGVPWLPNHLPISMQSFSIIHHICPVCQLAGFWECKSKGEGEGGGERGVFVLFFFHEWRVRATTRHCSSYTLTLRVSGGSSRAGWSLSSIWNLATYRVLCNSQYSCSSVRYLTPQSPAGWERGRGLLRLEAGVESFCGLW